MVDLTRYLRPEHANASVHEALRMPVSALSGVDADAVATLQLAGIETVFDLGASALFAAAAVAADAARVGGTAAALGVVPGDWLDPASSHEGPAGLADLPTNALRIVDDELAGRLQAGLGVETIRDLAMWPPRLAAHTIVSESMNDDQPTVDDAELLRPRLGEYPTERVYYQRLVMVHRERDEEPIPLSGPISLTGDVAANAGTSTKIAVGALLTYAQSWFAKGVTLGQLLHSLALAPGEATRIAIIDWARRTSASVAEDITESERLQNSARHARAISEVQNAVASEMQRGGSVSSGWAESTSTSESGGHSGGLVGGVFGGGSGGWSDTTAATEFGARSASWSVGTRSVTANLEQYVNDRTEQHTTSVRNRRASAVREVSQTEHEELSTRIVANYNHMHALTVQYFEVVQVYETLTKLHIAERCLFVPFAPLDFTAADADELIDRYRVALLRGALTRRARELLIEEATTTTIKPVGSGLPILVSAADVNAGLTYTAMRSAPRPTTPLRVEAELIDAGGELTVDMGSAEGTHGVEPPPTMPKPGPKEPPLGGLKPAWNLDQVAYVSNLLGQFVLRPGSPAIHLPDDDTLLGVRFEGFDVQNVKMERPGAAAAATTVSVPDGENEVMFDGIPLGEISSVSVSKAGAGKASGKLTLLCAHLGRLYDAPQIPLQLPASSGMVRVLTFATDRADRKKELRAHLQANASHYTRTVFRSMDTAMVVSLLSPYTWNGRPLLEQVEPTPLTVSGNYLVMRAPLEPTEDSGVPGKTWQTLIDDLRIGSRDDTRLVPIPTDGVFAEAVLGRSNSAEKLDITRFWNWQDSPAPLTPPEIAPLAAGSRSEAEGLTPGSLGAPVVTVNSPTALPDPSGLSSILGTVAAANMFRDMSGLAGTQAWRKPVPNRRSVPPRPLDNSPVTT